MRLAAMDCTVRYAVRPMRLEDVPQVEQIDRECFPTQWPTLSFGRQLLTNSISHYLVVHEPSNEYAETSDDAPACTENSLKERLRHFFEPQKALQAAATQRVIGMVGFWVMAGEAHISTIAVRQAHRRQGLGELLLMSAIELAQTLDTQVVTLEVRASNTAAQRLYEKYGFYRAGIRRAYYSDREDAVIMTTEPITTASFHRQFQHLKEAYVHAWGPVERKLT